MKFRYKALIYAATAISLVILSFGECCGLKPFLPGAFAALAFSRLNVFVIAPLFVLASFTSGFYLSEFLGYASFAVIVAAASFIKLKGAKRRLALLAAVIVGGAVYGAFGVSGGERLLASVAVEVALFAVVAFVFSCAICPIEQKRMRTLSVDECFYVYAAVACVFAGACGISLAGAELSLALLALVAPIADSVARKSGWINVSIAAGAGVAMAKVNAEWLALFCFIGAVSAVFVRAPGPLHAVSLIVACTFFRLFTSEYSSLLFDIAALAAGGIAACFLPKRLLFAVEECTAWSGKAYTIRRLMCEVVISERRRLASIAEIFRELSAYMWSEDEKSEYLPHRIANALDAEICAHCGVCARADRLVALEALCEKTFEKGRAGLEDAEYFVSRSCPRTARIIGDAGELAAVESARSKERERERRVQREISDYCAAAGEILLRGSEASGELVFSSAREEAATEELRAEGINALGALVKEGACDEVTVMVSGDADEKAIKSALETALSSAFEMRSVREVNGVNVYNFTEKTNYEVAFAVSSRSKERSAIGDSHSFVNLGSGKFMAALCDGMGSGEDAKRLSESALGLIECFFRAGFGIELALAAVNRLLTIGEGEGFVAFDAVIVDLNTLERNVVKLGTPATYLRGESEVKCVEGNALPLLAHDSVRPTFLTDTAKDGEIMIMVSDGVSDMFENGDLLALIASLPELPPKAMSEKILSAAISRKGAHDDDMTVMAIKTFRRV